MFMADVDGMVEMERIACDVCGMEWLEWIRLRWMG